MPYYFEKIFLIANININIVLKISFLIFNNINIELLEQKSI